MYRVRIRHAGAYLCQINGMGRRIVRRIPELIRGAVEEEVLPRESTVMRLVSRAGRPRIERSDLGVADIEVEARDVHHHTVTEAEIADDVVTVGGLSAVKDEGVIAAIAGKAIVASSSDQNIVAGGAGQVVDARSPGDGLSRQHTACIAVDMDIEGFDRGIAI